MTNSSVILSFVISLSNFGIMAMNAIQNLEVSPSITEVDITCTETFNRCQ